MLIRLLFIFLTSFCSGKLAAHHTVLPQGCHIKSAVGPNYQNGLHSKYIKRLANYLGCKVTLYEMPFQRRIVELKKGKIDLLVGIREKDKQSHIHLLPAPYESLPYRVFVRSELSNEVHDLEQLMLLDLAVSPHIYHFPELSLIPKSQQTIVPSLNQKISLLRKGRVDGFIHLEDVTVTHLTSNQLAAEVNMSVYQNDYLHHFFVGISKSSSLFKFSSEVNAVIENMRKAGEFKRIREQHYYGKTLKGAERCCKQVTHDW